MATPKTTTDRAVSRTYRAAIRLGEDFITLEEIITLPIDATDDAIVQAIELGLRIYHVQHEAIAAQTACIRATTSAPTPISVRDSDVPTSEKQCNFIATLQDHLGWTAEHLAEYAQEQQIELAHLTRSQASALIERLKTLVDEHQSAKKQPDADAPSPGHSTPLRTCAEAEQRFFARYGPIIGGAIWNAVQRYMRHRISKPQTINEWYTLAEAVSRRHQARSQRNAAPQSTHNAS